MTSVEFLNQSDLATYFMGQKARNNHLGGC